MIKYMGRPPHDHWVLQVLQPGLSLIRYGHQTLEINLVNAASTRNNISKVVDETNAEPMEPRVPKVNGTAKEIYFIRAFFCKTRPI